MSEVIDKLIEKYPVYKDWDRDELVARIAKKYPVYLEQPDFEEEVRASEERLRAKGKATRQGVVTGIGAVANRGGLGKVFGGMMGGKAVPEEVGKGTMVKEETPSLRPITGWEAAAPGWKWGTPEIAAEIPKAPISIPIPYPTTEGERVEAATARARRRLVAEWQEEHGFQAPDLFTAQWIDEEAVRWGNRAAQAPFQIGREETVLESATRPIVTGPTVSAEDVARVFGTGPKVSRAIAGVQQGFAGLLEFFATPLGIATLGAASFGLFARKLVARAFLADMAASVPARVAETARAVGEKDIEGTARGLVGLAATPVFMRSVARSHAALTEYGRMRDILSSGEKAPRRPRDIKGGKAPPPEEPKGTGDKGTPPPEEPKNVSGWQATTPDAEVTVKGVWDVVEADSAVTSMDQGYPQELQPRDRARTANREQVVKMSVNLDPERLGYTVSTDLGAPIVDEANVVLSGNGRLAAIRLRYASEEGGKDYQDFVLRETQRMDETIAGKAAGMKRPVLVRRALEYGGLSKAEFARRSNIQQIAGMSDAETARSDGYLLVDNPGRLDGLVFDAEGDLSFGENREFFQWFVEATGRDAHLMTATGLNLPAVQGRVRRALMALVVGPDDGALQVALVEGAERLKMKRIVAGVSQAAGPLVRLRGTEYNIGPEIGQALRDLVAIRQSGGKVADFLGQMPLLTDPKRTALSDYLLGVFDRAKTVADVRDVLMRYAQRVKDAVDYARPDLLGTELKTKEELLLGEKKKGASDERTDKSDEKSGGGKESGKGPVGPPGGGGRGSGEGEGEGGGGGGKGGGGRGSGEGEGGKGPGEPGGEGGGGGGRGRRGKKAVEDRTTGEEDRVGGDEEAVGDDLGDTKRSESGRIITARADLVKPADESVVPEQLRQHLDPHQRQGVAASIGSMDGNGGFLLADGTGVGKTREALAVAATMAGRGHRVVIVTKASSIKPNWLKRLFSGSYASDAKAMGVEVELVGAKPVEKGKIGLTTYENIAEVADWVDRVGRGDTVVILDEAHALKNVDSARSVAGMRLLGSAKSVLYMTATPVDKPQHIEYLWRMGILEGKTKVEALENLGLMRVNKKVGKRGQKKITIWMVDPRVGDKGVIRRFEDLFRRMTGAGRMLRREISMRGLAVDMVTVKMPQEVHALLDRIAEFIGGTTVSEARGLTRARILIAQRLQQEPHKIAKAVELTMAELNSGQSVIIFAARVRESAVKRPIFRQTTTGEWIKVGEEELTRSAGTMPELRKALEDAGVKPEEIAEYHGDVKGPEKGLNQFQNDNARVLLATVESGGTGINADDIRGKYPRTMIVMSAPYSAMENLQAVGRVWRLKTKSYPKIIYLWADTEVDAHNAAVVAKKFGTLGATIGGEIGKLQEAMDTEGEQVLAMPQQGLLPRRVEVPPLMGPGGGGGLTSVAMVREFLAKALDLPMRLGVRVPGKPNKPIAGLYRPLQETTRLASLNDLHAICHETGHHLHFILFPEGGKLGPKPTADDFTAYDAELQGLGQATSFSNYSAKAIRTEGVAEFTYKWLTDPAEARARAPRFCEYFERTISENFREVWDVLRDGQEFTQRYLAQDAVARNLSMIDGPWYENWRRTVRERWDSFKRLWPDFVNKWIDELKPLEDAYKALRAAGLPAGDQYDFIGKARNYVGGWRGKAEHWLERRRWDSAYGDMGEPLKAILDDVPDWARFELYLACKHAVDLHGRGLETGFQAPEAVVKLLEAEYGALGQRIWAYWSDLLKLRLASGMITNAEFIRLRTMYPHYVKMRPVEPAPVGRGSTGRGRGFVDVPKGLRRFTGGSPRIASILESLIADTYETIDAVERNRVGVALARALDATRGGGRMGESVMTPIKPMDLTDVELRRFLKESGLEHLLEEVEQEGGGSAAAAARFLDKRYPLEFRVWRQRNAQSARKGVLTTWEEGKEKAYQVDDPALYAALKLQDSVSTQITSGIPLYRFFAGTTRIVRAGATWTAEFATRNIFKDQIGAAIYSNYGYIPLFDGFRGLLHAIGKTDLYWKWVRDGGRYSDFIAVDRADLQRRLRHIAPQDLRDWLTYANPIRVLQALSELSDMATRLPEYERARRAGKPGYVAANEAKDVSLNFSKGGMLSRLVNMFQPFYKVGWLELDKLARAHKEHPVRTAARGLMYITVPSVVCWLLGRDDKAIQELSDFRKAFFWNINITPWLNRMGVRTDSPWVVPLPKPFLLGQIYGSSVERALDYAYQKDRRAVEKWIAGVLKGVPVPYNIAAARLEGSAAAGIQLQGVPFAGAPLFAAGLQLVSGRSAATGQKLVPRGLEALPVGEQATARTTMAAKMGAEFMGSIGLPMSPIAVDETVQAVFAGLGRYGMEAFDWMAAKAGMADLPPKPEKDMREWVGVRAFFMSPYGQGRTTERVYRAAAKMEERLAWMNAAQKMLVSDGQRKFLKREGKALEWYVEGRAQAIREGIRVLNQGSQARAMVMADRKMSPAAKRARLLAITQQRQKLAEEIWRSGLFWDGDKRAVE